MHNPDRLGGEQHDISSPTGHAEPYGNSGASLPAPKKYAVAYLRVSTDEQTVLNQKIQIQGFAASRGYSVLAWYEDEAISGKVPPMQRKAFGEMVEFLTSQGKGAVDAVFVYELSRLGRRFFETLEAIKIIDTYSILLPCSPKEEFLQSTEKSIRELMMAILSWVAQRERENLVQRTKDGLERARLQGKQIGRPKREFTEDEKEYIRDAIAVEIPRGRIAASMQVSKATFYKFLHAEDLMRFRRIPI